MAGEVVLSIDHLVKSFRIHQQRTNSLKELIAARGRNRYEEFVAVDDVTFEVREGEVFGVIGQNGSGKSTLLKCMAGILQPNAGTVKVTRRMGALLELGAGFHPELTGRENIFLNGLLLGRPRREIRERVDAIIDFSELGDFIHSPIRAYSSGMLGRLGFSIATAWIPEVLILDEIFAAGDAAFTRKCERRVAEFRAAGSTILVVSHAPHQILENCSRCIWLDHGRLLADGAPTEILDAYHQSTLEAAG